MHTVLGVEDDPLIALDLSETIAEATGISVVTALNLTAAEQALGSEITFAILDVNLGNETTFALARLLALRGVPFVFTSGFNRIGLPEDLRETVFLSKPCKFSEVLKAVRSGIAGYDA